ncbi:MaoC/PaaZ C-terminal domain-containing protein [Cryptosporangium sp. NPDC051539]|uniref:MaoC/PaaZ C-terminal domain-containing protein n=1 Tax=Cryptosporangium sp. NPDC051539 TaxID=3363962 RepID=UPI0037873D56
MALNPDAAGLTAEPRSLSWTSKEALLYAVSLGAGRDDLAFSTENSIGIDQAVLPTFPVVFLVNDEPATSVMAQIGSFDHAKVVHGSQAVTLHQPIPPEGRASAVERVVAMHDKGRAAVVVTETAATLESGEPLWSLTTSTFIRDAGGFGGERGPSGPKNVPPTTAPDFETVLPTSEDQAYLYRLNGDRNPLHSDPVFAVEAGFDRPILHGLCTYGFTARALLARFGKGDVSRFQHIEGRFSSPVLPGEALTVRAWQRGADVLFTTSVDDRLVLDQGLIRVAE